ncbi:MAG TPA: flavodoxin [Clostridium sp.]|uniref:flavodoxin n=1 Tax=Clostridium sp. TaxID=1506 RepID=UPI002F92C59B
MLFKKKNKWRNEEMEKILIAYFSRKDENYVNGSIVNLLVGNTEVAAKIAEEAFGGDLFEIKTVKKYPADYTETTNVAQVEKNQNARPELATHVENMDEYDTIILGYPNWWGTMPMAVFAFLDEYDFTGKTILPYCTHEGSGLGGSEQDIKHICPTANVEKGLAIQGGSVNIASGKIKSWLS